MDEADRRRLQSDPHFIAKTSFWRQMAGLNLWLETVERRARRPYETNRVCASDQARLKYLILGRWACIAIVGLCELELWWAAAMAVEQLQTAMMRVIHPEWPQLVSVFPETLELKVLLTTGRNLTIRVPPPCGHPLPTEGCPCLRPTDEAVAAARGATGP